jgi:hypothetical protein
VLRYPHSVTGAATTFSTAVATASLLALGCAHRAPEPHGPSALKSNVDLDGCLEDVHLRPGTYADAEVLFTCPASPTPMIILRGRGHTPYRPPDHALDRVRFKRVLPEAEEGLVHDLAYYGPGYAAAPPCTTEGRGLVMWIYGYLYVDRLVDGLRKWIQANDLDVELVILFTPEPPWSGPPVVIPGWD